MLSLSSRNWPGRREGPIITASNLTKKIGSKTILQDINLEIHSGEFVTILGPNGAGKTTLLKILSLLLQPTSGELLINGNKVGDNAIKLRRQIGVISHHTFLYDNLTAYENLLFYGKMYGVTNLKERIQEVIEEVGLEYCLADPVRTFSRGMQQRLSIARAIIHNPSILFLDEPYTGLDQHAIGILNRVLARLANEDRTIFLITHNFEEALKLSNRVVILVKGKIVYQGETQQLTAEQFKQLYLEYVEGAG
ncbi:heme ABC exporter ATP-binding protein CcmA [Calderihabitans maritimus]|uniref:Heme ABC transporter ATP-binding protein CcmA n=1 Tax=Calderihabitans maritimus TaxID=1246530 RepID=A0A1Z5HWS8_9FIRM|nr:heme ABC exporter ATP-binding protein CcmA [Calderihabitans maritimus]GAW93740.1 heme ABC transporter ATP-binding protein CcmA [Calderihabitans maritimus]